jgi:hypothetical protein
LRAAAWPFAFLILLALVLSYGWDSGHGFVKDDFRWIVESRVRSMGDLPRVFMNENGFYRPVVSLSFAADEWLLGSWPKGYALTNLAILFLCAAALVGLCRALEMELGVALLAAGLWSLNPHGISGLVMWISGRTSGLATLFALLTAWAFVRGRHWLAAAACALALLSKEEAFLLPLALTVWAGWDLEVRRWNVRRAVQKGWPLLLTLPPYLALRAQTAAYLPSTAPSYYRFTLDPAALGRNVLEYADRAGTFTLAVLLLMILLGGVRRLRRLETAERRWIALGLIWLVAGFALTGPIPSRSSLYVCLPLVGVAIAGAAVARCIWSQASPRARSRLVIVAIVAPLALVPLQRSRNLRSRRAADLSAAVVAQLEGVRADLSSGATVVLVDEPGRRPNLREAFGSLLSPAVALTIGLDVTTEYRPSLAEWQEVRIRLVGAAADGPERRLRVQDGRLGAAEPASSAVAIP